MRSRLTVVEQVYFQNINSQPINADSRFSRNLETEASPTKQRLSVEEEWRAVIYPGFNVGMVVIVNEEGSLGRVNPTEEELAATKAKIVEVSCGITSSPYSWLIPPGESHRGTPADISRMYLRCQKGTAMCTVHLFPSD